MDGAIGQSGRTIATCDLTAQHATHGAVDVADGEAAGDGSLRFKRWRGLGDEPMIEGLIEAVILGLHFAARHTRGQRGHIEDRGEIDALGLPMSIGDGGVEALDAANHFIDGAEAEFGHVLANLVGEEEEEVDYVLRLAGKASSQDGVLGGNTDRTSVQVTLAHHDTTHSDQGGCSEAEFFGAEQSSDNNVTACLQLAVGLDLDTAAQV